jgi:DNA primase
MSLPPGFLDELRTRTTLSAVVGRKVTWDARKSNQAKGDFWAPCPFHQEKTASFHVDDRKGFYYCFGCHAKGDAVSFLRETGNMSFMEAVEELSRAVGMTMPARDPKAVEVADRNARLAEVMEDAVRHYRLQLRTGAAAAARDYLAGRGLTEAAQERFEIGFAPDQRQGLFTALTGRGIVAELIVESGLCAKPDDGTGAPYDRFRGRIIYPIRDARGRCIGLGGRAMDPNARAKYLNSPETPLFDKGRSLYNHAPAREAAAKGQRLIVAEGYMDVIALVQAGFGAAVAPLGTAITEDQLRMIWRIHPEPVVALDGDRAGIAAAMRLLDLALPLISATQSLRFVILPEGMDPDDLIRSRGAPAMQALVDQAEPMVALMWRRAVEGRVLDSPERRAALDADLRAALRRIADPSVRSHYADAIRERRADLLAPAARRQAVPAGPLAGRPRRPDAPLQGRGWKSEQSPALPATRGSMLAQAAGARAEDRLAEAVILAILCVHPDCIAAVEARIERLEMTGDDHRTIRDAILRHAVDPIVAGDPQRFRAAVGAETDGALEKLFALPHVRIAPPLRDAGDRDYAALCLTEALDRLDARRGVEAEIAEAMADMAGLADEGVTWRLARAAEARDRAGKVDLDDMSASADNAADLSAKLQEMIDREVWIKKKR